MTVTCVNACLQGCNRGMIHSETWDSDTERYIPVDYVCACHGTQCMACSYGFPCEVSGRDYSEDTPSGFSWWDDDREDYERFDD